jgi:hypothetical protein
VKISKAERVCLESEARTVARAYRQRVIEESDARREAGSLMPILREVLMRGCFVPSAGGDSLRLNDRQQWIVNVTWILHEIGMPLAQALLLRLTRPQKTEASSWGRICVDLEIAADERQMDVHYRGALVKFVDLLHRREITSDYSGDASHVRVDPTFYDPATKAIAPCRLDSASEVFVRRILRMRRMKIGFPGISAPRARHRRNSRQAESAAGAAVVPVTEMVQ